MSGLSEKLHNFLKDYFTIPRSTQQEAEAVADIRKGVNFRGSTLWILICAIFIASLGLNVNSTAVIIGAMLISPLMGPIIGIGYSVGTYDFELLKRSFLNFIVATVMSVITATVYFFITPLDTAQSEILARTSPTFYDICIALAGGIAGVIAIATREKGNVVPGVAIATAIMPPLCTAGFGIATGNLAYAAGALFLFFINVVFIATATYLGVVLMGFQKQTSLDKKHARKLYGFMIAVVLAAFCPAIFLTVNIVRQTLYEKSANSFIESEFGNLDNTIIIDKSVSFKDRTLKVILYGSEITPQEESIFKSHLSNYNLPNTTLQIVNGAPDKRDVTTIKSMIIEDLYKNTENKLHIQQRQIVELNSELSAYRLCDSIAPVISAESALLFPSIEKISLSRTVEANIRTNTLDTVSMVMVEMKSGKQTLDRNKFKKWIILKMGEENVEVIYR